VGALIAGRHDSSPARHGCVPPLGTKEGAVGGGHQPCLETARRLTVEVSQAAKRGDADGYRDPRQRSSGPHGPGRVGRDVAPEMLCQRTGTFLARSPLDHDELVTSETKHLTDARGGFA